MPRAGPGPLRHDAVVVDVPDPRGERAVLRDGTEVLVRALRPEDADMLTLGMEHLSAESRYRRFMSAKPSLSASEVERLTTPDGERHVAFGASDPAQAGPVGRAEGLGIGTARYFRSADDPASAEFAVTVIDQYRHRGVATLLLDHLTQYAREHGVERLTADVLSVNRPIIELIRSRDGVVSIVPEDRTVMTAVMPVADRVP